MNSYCRKALLLILVLFVWSAVPIRAQQAPGPRERVRFTSGWQFHLGDIDNGSNPQLDDSGWRTLNLPHDWSIEGSFDRDNPAGAGGGYLPGGIGWYRKSFTLPDEMRGKQVFIDFDGVYQNSEVWINGHYLGKRPYGYSSFRYELTPWLHKGDRQNVLAVRVDNSQQPNSRWYSGSGIYRNVWLVSTQKIHVDHWGTYITTPEVNETAAYVEARTRLRNQTHSSQKVKVTTRLLEAGGKVVAEASSEEELPADSTESLVHTLSVANPLLWSIEDPYLYRAETLVSREGETLDRYVTDFGIRYFHFDSNDGFFLNGVSTKIRGVCEHHDLGSLGAAVNKSALERRLRILKSMGVNAIRTSHNPPSPELLALTDRMGFIVMDEAFDVWSKKKTTYDYHLHWDKWHHRDLRDLVMRDRNHPSVMIWSIGNEILEQWDSTGVAIARDLASTVRELDPTRPITAGLNGPEPGNFVIRSGALDLIGYNYHSKWFPDFPHNFPGKKFIATETASALATRGEYDMPADSIRRWPEAWDKPFTDGNADHTVSAYDNVSAPWGATHKETLHAIQAANYLSGMFIWTGFDYIGEPTPYQWPSRSSYFGLVDLSGFPKDSYYLYQSEWTDKPVLHLLPHWNWQEGDTVDVVAYTNASQVELYLNGQSLGRKKKTAGQYQLLWRVPWQSGTLLAKGRTRNGRIITEQINTAGKPARIQLSVDRQTIAADGRDLAFVQVAIVDRDGVLVPHADNEVTFELSGPARIAGVSSGDPTSLESFKADHRKAFNGRCQVTLQSLTKEGTITLRAKAKGLKTSVVTVHANSRAGE